MDKILSQKLLLRKFTRIATKKNVCPRVMVLALCMLVNVYMTTHENILNILKVKIGHDLVTKNATFRVQRGITKRT